MATVTHYIYSHYDPDNPQTPEEPIDIDEAWEQEAPRLNRLQGPAPQFVPATIPYYDCDSGQAFLFKNSTNVESSNALGSSLSEWYRSLTSSRVSTPDIPASSLKKPLHETVTPITRFPAPVNKNNWFIMNAIQSQPSSSTSAPSLAEILDRDPPPLPSQKKYTPPVWLEIGPTNKGFEMLQKAGWNEGEPLGPAVVRRKPVEHILPDELFQTRKHKGKAKASQNAPNSMILRKETREVEVDDMDDITELRQIDVIDLSMCSDDAHSDSSSSSEEGSISEETSPHGRAQTSQSHDNAAYEPKALLTPIPTVLKSDRLGVGLKAKTLGPYKASQKRVTHNAAALAVHTKSAEESKRRRELFGRGRRGFERRHKKEEERRQAMIAYLKGP